MARIGTFSRQTDNTLAEARDGTDTLAAWRNDDGVTVRVTVHEYPHQQDAVKPDADSVRVAEYWISVSGSEDMDGAGMEAPFDGIHNTVGDAKGAARDVMHDIAGED